MTGLHRFRRILLICFLILPFTNARAEERPSATLLLQSWKASSNQLTRNLHSYHLSGNAIVTGPGQGTSGQTVSSPLGNWSATNANNLFMWKATLGGQRITASYDGSRWYYLVDINGSRSQYSVMTKAGDITGRPIRDAFIQDASAFPFDLKLLLDDPWRTDKQIPIYEFLLSAVNHITVSGPDEIVGLQCFHLHLPTEYVPHGVNIPEDVWLAAQGNQFVPIKLQTIDKPDNLRVTMMIDKAISSNGLWLPCEFTRALESGESGNWKAFNVTHTTLAITDINRKYSPSDFIIPQPTGGHVYVDDVESVTPAARATIPVPTAIIVLRWCLSLVVIVSLLILLGNAMKRRVS